MTRIYNSSISYYNQRMIKMNYFYKKTQAAQDLLGRPKDEKTKGRLFIYN